MKRYRLIKEYNGSPILNTEIVETMIIGNKPKFKTFTISGYDKSCNLGRFRLDNPEISPEFWEEVVEKDYEILSLKPKGGGDFRTVKSLFEETLNIYKTIDYFIECFTSNVWDIHSVRRLSDNVQFKVGDNTNKGKIKGFLLYGRYIHASCVNNPTAYFSGGIDKLKHIKKPLFTTEDGVDIFAGMSFYYVCEELELYNTICCTDEKKYENAKQFSTKEKAEEYILLNKPCLSLQDLLNSKIWSKTGCVMQQLIRLVKSKS